MKRPERRIKMKLPRRKFLHLAAGVAAWQFCCCKTSLLMLLKLKS